MINQIKIDIAKELIVEAYRKGELSNEHIDELVDYATYFASKVTEGMTEIPSVTPTSAIASTESNIQVETKNNEQISDKDEQADEALYNEMIEASKDEMISEVGEVGEIKSGISDIDNYTFKKQQKELDITESMIFFQKVEAIMVRKKLFCDQEVNRDQVAAAIGTNRTYLIRSIKVATGKTFFSYINDLRTDYAATLLTTTDEPLDLIGTIAGFRSRSTYYRSFAARYGVSPSDYRLRKTPIV